MVRGDILVSVWIPLMSESMLAAVCTHYILCISRLNFTKLAWIHKWDRQRGDKVLVTSTPFSRSKEVLVHQCCYDNFFALMIAFEPTCGISSDLPRCIIKTSLGALQIQVTSILFSRTQEDLNM